MITVAELDAYVDAGIDATGSQRYLFDQDKIPNYNSAISRATTACAWQLANRKGAEEALSELQDSRIFQTNGFGGLTLEGIQTSSFVPYTNTIWTVMGLYAEPTTNVTSPILLGNPATTYLRTDLVWRPGGANERPVQRMTMEQVAVARDSMMMSGNEVLAAGPMRTYGYYFAGKRTDGSSIVGGRELFITPLSRTSRVLVAMSFLRTPAPIVSDTDTIDFPKSMARTIASWAMEYLSIKQGDQTTLHSTAEKDAAMLFNFATQ